MCYPNSEPWTSAARGARSLAWRCWRQAGCDDGDGAAVQQGIGELEIRDGGGCMAARPGVCASRASLFLCVVCAQWPRQVPRLGVAKAAFRCACHHFPVGVSLRRRVPPWDAGINANGVGCGYQCGWRRPRSPLRFLVCYCVVVWRCFLDQDRIFFKGSKSALLINTMKTL
jgi:hypothetical protein